MVMKLNTVLMSQSSIKKKGADTAGVVGTNVGERPLSESDPSLLQPGGGRMFLLLN